ncbi:hypothetical protein C8J31_110138 [Rhizobium sp. PP-CC-2G-626]|nr:hypothetical protein C8J31_110138 [Rhizobium sp. PP-CC-2G-626]
MIGSSQSSSAKGNDVGFTLSANAVGRAMSMQFLGDHVNAQSSRTPARDLAAFIQIDLGVGAFHVLFTARINRRYLLQVALLSVA